MNLAHYSELSKHIISWKWIAEGHTSIKVEEHIDSYAPRPYRIINTSLSYFFLFPCCWKNRNNTPKLSICFTFRLFVKQVVCIMDRRLLPREFHSCWSWKNRFHSWSRGCRRWSSSSPVDLTGFFWLQWPHIAGDGLGLSVSTCCRSQFKLAPARRGNCWLARPALRC